MRDRNELIGLAEATLRQELPDDLAWIPWHDLPPMRWREDASPVDVRVVRGWVVASVLRGAATPNEALRQQASLFVPDDAGALAVWALRAWITHDTTPRPPMTAERENELRSIAARGAELAARLGRDGTRSDDRFRALAAMETCQSAPSALPQQGLLAVTAAGAHGDAVPRMLDDARRYLETWNDHRPARCRAMARMVAAIDEAVDRPTPGR